VRTHDPVGGGFAVIWPDEDILGGALDLLTTDDADLAARFEDLYLSPQLPGEPHVVAVEEAHVPALRLLEVGVPGRRRPVVPGSADVV